MIIFISKSFLPLLPARETPQNPLTAINVAANHMNNGFNICQMIYLVPELYSMLLITSKSIALMPKEIPDKKVGKNPCKSKSIDKNISKNVDKNVSKQQAKTSIFDDQSRSLVLSMINKSQSVRHLPLFWPDPELDSQTDGQISTSDRVEKRLAENFPTMMKMINRQRYTVEFITDIRTDCTKKITAPETSLLGRIWNFIQSIAIQHFEDESTESLKWLRVYPYSIDAVKTGSIVINNFVNNQPYQDKLKEFAYDCGILLSDWTDTLTGEFIESTANSHSTVPVYDINNIHILYPKSNHRIPFVDNTKKIISLGEDKEIVTTWPGVNTNKLFCLDNDKLTN